jgi:hypothetical protein
MSVDISSTSYYSAYVYCDICDRRYSDCDDLDAADSLHCMSERELIDAAIDYFHEYEPEVFDENGETICPDCRPEDHPEVEVMEVNPERMERQMQTRRSEQKAVLCNWEAAFNQLHTTGEKQ